MRLRKREQQLEAEREARWLRNDRRTQDRWERVEPQLIRLAGHVVAGHPRTRIVFSTFALSLEERRPKFDTLSPGKARKDAVVDAARKARWRNSNALMEQLFYIDRPVPGTYLAASREAQFGEALTQAGWGIAAAAYEELVEYYGCESVELGTLREAIKAETTAAETNNWRRGSPGTG